MSLLSRPETRDIDSEAVFGSSWQSLGRGAARRQAATYAAIRYIADQWAQSSITVTEMRGGYAEPIDTPLILSDPSPTLSVWDSKVQMVGALKSRGNAYGLVDDGRRYCQWLPDEWVQIDDSRPMSPRYYVNGRLVKLVKEGGNLLHVREVSTAGSVRGLSPIEEFASSFEWADLARQYGRRWFQQSAMPPAILQAKTTNKGGAALKEARDDFIEAAREGKPVALPGEWEYKPIMVAPEQAQFLQTIEASATEIAIIYGVPPEKVGGKAGSSRTYSNLEMDQRSFRLETLGGVSGRASAAQLDLIKHGQAVTYDLSALERPGLLEYMRAITEQLRNGTLTQPEARRDLGRRGMTEAEINDWQQHYTTTKSQSEAIAESISTSITKETT